MDFTVRQWNWASALMCPFRGVLFLCFGAGNSCTARGVMMSLSPQTADCSLLRGNHQRTHAMHPYRLIQRTHRDMPTATVIRQPYRMCPCHVRADADTCDASLHVMPCGIRA
ncbi:MAG: hypothetical protein IKP54_10340 [Bacteroidales bacterium]|nr:hypothetical protein [Bacteroidales bacterium]